MSKIISVTCKRCGGSGKFSFNLIRGTVCFGCNGSGNILTTQAKINAVKKAKIKSATKKELERELLSIKIEAHNIALAARIEKYKMILVSEPKRKPGAKSFQQLQNRLTTHWKCLIVVKFYTASKIWQNRVL
jgi:DnaJ-class molecular chaperone